MSFCDISGADSNFDSDGAKPRHRVWLHPGAWQGQRPTYEQSFVEVVHKTGDWSYLVTEKKGIIFIFF